MNKVIRSLATLLLSLLTTVPAWSADGTLDMSAEIQQLNKDFGEALSYPIFILDKILIRQQLEQKNLLHSEDESAIAQEIILFVQNNSKITLSENDAVALVPYVTVSNGSALAQPFFQRDAQVAQMKYCLVSPNGLPHTHAEETQRVLGIQDGINLYKNLDLRRVQALLSLDELRLFSLYHELSHCLDQKYLPRLYDHEPDSHQIHLAETFAEVNALFLLAQRKDLKRLGVPRSLLRTLYSKYFGPYLASQPPSIAGPAYNEGGAIYFLSLSLLQAQHLIEKNNMEILSLTKIISLSQQVVDGFTLKSRSFQGLLTLYREGPAALHQYRKLAEDSPDLFYATYVDLISIHNMLLSAEDFLPQVQP